MNSELKELLALYDFKTFISFLDFPNFEYYYLISGSEFLRITVFGKFNNYIVDNDFIYITINNVQYTISKLFINQLAINYKRFIQLRMFI